MAAILLAASCGEKVSPDVDDENAEAVLDSITVSSPTPTEQIKNISLTDTQKGYVAAGNKMSFRLLNKMYDGRNLICSPLSLQYALAMVANGASGETLQEIIDFLGYGSDGIDALNAYSKTLLEQLPAVDLNVTLKVTDALLVNYKFPLLPAYRDGVMNNYYAAVENMSFSNPVMVANRINEWAKRNTNGFIDKVLEPNEISPSAAAYIMNALYFKAKWSEMDFSPMFIPDRTKSETFTQDGGQKKELQMMQTSGYYRYAEMNGVRVLELPFESGKFKMYFLLPDKRNLKEMIDKLESIPWGSVLDNMKKDALVKIKIPTFDIEERYGLKQILQGLGVKRAFSPILAQFDHMFNSTGGFVINSVLQKARITVAEWGTEAAAVTVFEMATSPGPGNPEPEPKIIEFYADHPFAFVIAESTSGTILFEGAFTGK